MFSALFDYFLTIFTNLQLPSGADLSEIMFDIGGAGINLYEWLALTATIIMMVVIFVCCLLFVWKIVKVVSRLFTGA